MKLSVDSKQRVTTTCLMFLEFYKILMATFLVLFVPQKCDEEVCTITQNYYKRSIFDLERFIFSLGIRHIGLENAKLLSKYFMSFTNFKNLSKTNKYNELLNIDGIGETQVNSVKNFFSVSINLKVLNILLESISIFWC